MDKKQFQTLHGLTDDEMEFIDFIKKETSGKITNVFNQPCQDKWKEEFKNKFDF